MRHTTPPRRGAVYLLLLPVTILSGWVSQCRADELHYPLSIAVADSGTIFLADRKLPGIWKLESNQLLAFYLGGREFRTPLSAIRCVALDRDGRLLAGDSATRDVYRFDESGHPLPLTRPAADAAANAVPPGKIGMPVDIAVDSSGGIYVSDLETGRIMKLGPEGGDPTEVAQIAGCRGLFVDGQDRLWVVSTTADQLHRIAPDGSSEVIVKGRTFQFPHTVVVDDQGTAYVCDGYAQAIWKIEAGSEPRKWVQGPPLKNPVGMAIQGGKIYVADPRAQAVFTIDAQGQVNEVVSDQ